MSANKIDSVLSHQILSWWYH